MHTHRGQTKVFSGESFNVCEKTVEKLFLLKTQIKVFCLPLQENVVVSQLKKKQERNSGTLNS